MIEYFYCPCCGETGKLENDADLLFAGLVIECECGAVFEVKFSEVEGDGQRELAGT